MGKRRIDPRVEVGSVHLPARDLDRMLGFYGDVLGFNITHRVGDSAAILSAGDWHPHIVLAAGGDRPVTVPCAFSIRYPDRGRLAQAYRAVLEADLAVEGARDEGLREVLYLRDPEGNEVALYYDRPRDEWPLQADGTLRLESRPLDLDALRLDDWKVTGRAAEPVANAISVPPLSVVTRTRLSDVRLRLLNLHKVLLDDAKTAYELDRGRVGSNASLLQLVINDPWFAWLHPLSELVVHIDETLQPDAPATEADGVVLLEQVERLLSPAESSEDFAHRYYEALQRQPAVVVAHAEVRRILKQVK